MVITGPTASGKTRLSIEAAEKFSQIEIVSCDSAQVYKYMDIGTDKPSQEIRARIPHHMIDIVEPSVRYDAHSYQVEARDVIQKIRSRRRVPVVVGGSTFYLHALLFGLPPRLPSDESLRKKLESLEDPYAELLKIDPERARALHPSDRKRIIRALEIYHLTGKRPSEFKEYFERGASPLYPPPIVVVLKPPSNLKKRIHQRIDRQLASGFLDEVKHIVQKYSFNCPGLSHVGYRQLAEYLAGYRTFSSAVEEIKKRTYLLAKRQITWLKRYRQNNFLWLDYREARLRLFEILQGLVSDL